MKVVVRDIPCLPQETLKSLENDETITVHMRGHVLDLVIDDANLARDVLEERCGVILQ